jgi:hypothetical protein
MSSVASGPQEADFTEEVGNMALKELELLTGELEQLALMLRDENRSQARLEIMRRVHEIMTEIGEKENE